MSIIEQNRKPAGRYTIPILLLLFVAVLIRHIPGHEYDNELFRNWAIHNAYWGLGKAYYSGSDYLPLYHYILYGFAKLLGDPAKVTQWFHYIHLVTFLFDMLGIWFIYKWADRRYSYNTLLLLLVLNVAYTYNTLIWGQVDGILATLIFISLYFAWKGRMAAGAVFFILAVNMKLQGIVFLPIFGLLYLFNIAVKRNWKSAVLPLVAAGLTQFLVVLPFLIEGEGLPLLWDAVGGSVGRLSFVSLHACNFWYLLFEYPIYMPDSDIYLLGLTYKQVGLILFMAASFLVLLPLMRSVWKAMFSKNADRRVDRVQLWLVAALIALLFWYFNTQMHERYNHPAFIFIAVYAFYSKDFVPLVVFSVAYFLCLDRVLHWTGLNVVNEKLLIYNPSFLAYLFSFVMLWLFARLVMSVRREKSDSL